MNTEIKQVITDPATGYERFLYGKRLKATLQPSRKYNCTIVTLFKTRKEIYKRYMVLDNNKTFLENYQKAVDEILNYLNTCKY